MEQPRVMLFFPIVHAYFAHGPDCGVKRMKCSVRSEQKSGQRLVVPIVVEVQA